MRGPSLDGPLDFSRNTVLQVPLTGPSPAATTICEVAKIPRPGGPGSGPVTSGIKRPVSSGPGGGVLQPRQCVLAMGQSQVPVSNSFANLRQGVGLPRPRTWQLSLSEGLPATFSQHLHWRGSGLPNALKPPHHHQTTKIRRAEFGSTSEIGFIRQRGKMAEVTFPTLSSGIVHLSPGRKPHPLLEARRWDGLRTGRF